MKRIFVALLFIFLSSKSAALGQNAAFQYAAKFVCGPSRGIVVAPGVYFTAINVHNPSTRPAEFKNKIAVALPAEQPGRVTPFFPAKLGPDQAFEIDCQDILRHSHAEGFVKGFVVIESNVELDVVAVYTTVGANERVGAFFLERVPARRQ